MKLKVGVIFGGKSSEHEVSLMSATSILKVMDKNKYEVIPIGITREGEWYIYKGDFEKILKDEWLPEAKKAYMPSDNGYKGIFTIENGKVEKHELDVVFPVLHGPNGEDGTIQGLFELAGIPYVSCNVLSSSVAMDKVFTKRLLEQAGLPQAHYKVYMKNDITKSLEQTIKDIEQNFEYPCFIKPANLGSSVGITKAHNEKELAEGLKLASKYDRKILVEEFIEGREIECSVLGNDNPKASLPGEIIPCNEFYDYQAKYFDEGKSRLLIPAPLSEEKTEEIKQLAVKAYKALDCQIMARVDVFLQKDTQKVYINELNTIPGFTKISMYPKLWEASGLSYSKLIDELIRLSIERFEENRSQSI
ncbi:MAG: D-alanine-D-alanine ligase [Thermosediminibacterales bacterium]|nr:D-alanine-D-alanine ligase [Thermosediminibacterales bacterium]MDK2835487.1 D-alanine-D-alanine ligase [Thermosediminibacterales bacterium]